ncbi:MAG: ImmA/IrrE family metallo-endopeptidase [Pirellulales bacterium]|nr:ImmA/IrrE family metallo-endopeptidase [Alphaproteobacteria bacterium]MDA8008900.1 ImmA/IrrE family metallo-endopeptidase [Alphaproteobacteria bacterium]MDA8040947.1 ImmA/IrrE family metallo-endopeptidase [Pirellulales bacterium]
MNKFESISSSLPVDVGDRLRRARDDADLTQQEAADAIEIARTTLVAIEGGQRQPRINELQRLAKLYGFSVNALLREESVHVDLVPRFRRLSNATDAAASEAIDMMSRLARAEVEFEKLLGIKHVRNYPPERPILRGDVRKQAEHDALDLRRHLGMGSAPVADMVTLLEMEMNVRVYVRKIDRDISGLFAYDENIGPCIMLNANHRRQRRAYSAAHECGHFISTRNTPEVLHKGEAANSREERYANAFARAFLMPPPAVEQKFHEVTAGSDRRICTRQHVIVLAHFFSVSREAIVRRLEELELVKEGAWDWFEDNGGITDQQVKRVLGDSAVTDPREAERPMTLRLNLLAAEVYRQDLLTEGQISELLDLDRVEFRKFLDDLEIEGSDTSAISVSAD